MRGYRIAIQEVAMSKTTRPTKEALRHYLQQRVLEPIVPPPSPEEIRRQLNWHLLPLKRRPDWTDPE